MADYPVPKFHFQVEWGGTQIGFTEVSGLALKTEVIEYRHGANKDFIKTKQPGMRTESDVTLKRGTFYQDNEYYDWWKENVFFEEGNSTGSKFRRDITISLLNENHEPIVVWKLKNAWITDLKSTDLNSTSNEIAIEEVTLAHEGLVIQNE